MALNARQKCFVQEYLIDLNATQAGIRAGYSKKTAEQQGCRLLRNAQVAAAISEAQAKRSKRTEVTQDRVLAELAKIGFSDIRKAVEWGSQSVNLVPSDEMDDETAAAISEVSMTAQGIKIKMNDKRAALETLLRHLGDGDGDDEAPPITININTADPVESVSVTRSEA